MFSPVEKFFLDKSGLPHSFPNEAISAIQVSNIYELGKMISLRFLEWAIENPTGVVALPTGRTPEFFIKTLEKFKLHWKEESVQQEVKQCGIISCEEFPDTSKLNFVMLDEFFPMKSSHRNSFCKYIRTYYVDLLNISHENVLTFDFIEEGVVSEKEMQLFDEPDVDIGLLQRDPQDELETTKKLVLEKISSYCELYEKKIESMGGIGFFLGGIGPDGHIAFNQYGDSLTSRTRLVKFNYPSAAAAAGDLGGIEHSRGRAAVTIGLGTITAKEDATIVILAAGEGKAKVVRQALEEKNHPLNPASALHSCQGARFYITQGAACNLSARRARDICNASSGECLNWALGHLSGATCSGGLQPALQSIPPSDYEAIEQFLYSSSVRLQIPVHKLTSDVLDDGAVGGYSNCPDFLKDEVTCRVLVACASRRLREKIDAGVHAMSERGRSILHTAPHHDDIMLSYHGAMHQMLGRRQGSEEAPVVPHMEKCHSSSSFSEDVSSSVSSSFGLLSTEPMPPSPAGNNHQKKKKGHRRNRSGSDLNLARFHHCTDINAALGERHGKNVNHFAYLTSGFHSVNEDFIRDHCTELLETCSCISTEKGRRSHSVLEHIVLDGQITRDYDELLVEFRSLFLLREREEERTIEHIIFLRNVCKVWDIVTTLAYNTLCDALTKKVTWLLENYLKNHQPGDSIPKDIQLFKGCMRESEVDRVWALSKMPNARIHHLRSKFYTDDFFTPMPSLEDDAMPLANLIRSRQPSVLTVAFDPEGTGPDTHYKVLLVVAASLRLSINRGDLLLDSNPLIWGYRNVWFEFAPGDATLMIPVSESDLTLMHDTFMSCFTTQKSASFPSPYFDGPFSAWAMQIQKRQRRLLRVLLGDEYFLEHSDELVRTSSGFIFIKAMYANEFLAAVEQLKSRLEAKS